MMEQKKYYVAIDQETGGAVGAGRTVLEAMQDVQQYHPDCVFEIHSATRRLHDSIIHFDCHAAICWINGDLYDLFEPPF